jgi:hypothetical protein
MPNTPNPFPLPYVEKINSPELLAQLAQYGPQLYADANELNSIFQALNYLYEHTDEGAQTNKNLTPYVELDPDRDFEIADLSRLLLPTQDVSSYGVYSVPLGLFSKADRIEVLAQFDATFTTVIVMPSNVHVIFNGIDYNNDYIFIPQGTKAILINIGGNYWVMTYEVSETRKPFSLELTLEQGRNTGGTNILVDDADAIELENDSLLKKGTYDFGGNGGISRICSVGYEDMWQSGIRHVFDNNGFIRNSTNCFNIIPDFTFDSLSRFKVGSRWILDDGTIYICTDATTGAAIWQIAPIVWRKDSNVYTLFNNIDQSFEFWNLTISEDYPINIWSQDQISVAMSLSADFVSASTRVDVNVGGSITSRIYGGYKSFVYNTLGKILQLKAPDTIPEDLVQEFPSKSGVFAMTSDLLDKVDKVTGYGLSQQNFSSADKSKLDSLSNYTGFRGVKSSLALVISSYPTGTAGDWAIISNPTGNAYFAIWDTDIPGWVDAGQSPTIPGTNLAYTIVGNVLTITSDTGNDVVIPLATSTAAGLLSKEDKSKLDGIDLSLYLLLTNISNVLNGTSTSKALSEAQGKVLKDLIDALSAVVSGKQNSLGYVAAVKRSFISLNADFTLDNTSTALQDLFGKTCNVVAGKKYRFMAEITILDATSSTSSFSLGSLGTATLSKFKYQVFVKKNGNISSPAGSQMTAINAVGATSLVVTPSIATAIQCIVWGTFIASGSGTFKLAGALSATGGTPKNENTSFFELYELGTSTEETYGLIS